MRSEAIFAPVAALALWTIAVLLLTGVQRVRAVRAGRVRRGAFRLGESADVPADVAVVNRNLMNLLEMPVLFYVVSIALYVTGHVDGTAVVLGWSYFGLRLLHSFVHLTTNRILQRLAVFAVGNVVLLGIWLRFLWVVL